jgi:hypothetical protein
MLSARVSRTVLALGVLAGVSFAEAAHADTFYAVQGYNPIGPGRYNTLFVITDRLSYSFYTQPFLAIDKGGNFGGGWVAVKQSDYLDIDGKPLPLSWTLNHYYTYLLTQACQQYGLHIATIPDLAYQNMNSLFGPINQARLDQFIQQTPYAIANGQITPFGISLIPQGTVNTQIATVLFDDGAESFPGLPQIAGLFLGIPSQFGQPARPEALVGVESAGLLTGNNCKPTAGAVDNGCINDPPEFIGALVCSD